MGCDNKKKKEKKAVMEKIAAGFFKRAQQYYQQPQYQTHKEESSALGNVGKGFASGTAATGLVGMQKLKGRMKGEMGKVKSLRESAHKLTKKPGLIGRLGDNPANRKAMREYQRGEARRMMGQLKSKRDMLRGKNVKGAVKHFMRYGKPKRLLAGGLTAAALYGGYKAFKGDGK